MYFLNSIIGPNGCGKSTLVNLLVGQLEPDEGSIRHGTRLEIAYFDQLRATLDTKASVADNVSGGRDTVMVNGAERHIMSYLQDFLFEPARARAPITALSGGETGRLMLAKLFLKPSNVIVLDEPSKDLDIETLELLESLLADYAGTVILISHDRQLLENVVTRSLVYQGDGRFVNVIGAWDDFERERATSTTLKPVFDADTVGNLSASATARGQASSSSTANANASASATQTKPVKLSYKLQRELDELPAAIDALEARLAKLQDEIGAADFYRDRERAERVVDEATEAQQALDAGYARWDELETMSTRGD